MFINMAGPRLWGEDGQDGPARRASGPFDQVECRLCQQALSRRLYVRLNQLSKQDFGARGATPQHHHHHHQHQHQHQHQHHPRPHHKQQPYRRQHKLEHREKKPSHHQPPPLAQPQLKMELQPRCFPGDELDDYYMVRSASLCCLASPCLAGHQTLPPSPPPPPPSCCCCCFPFSFRLPLAWNQTPPTARCLPGC